MFMGKIVVSIPLITWRAGRPRFSPGPRLRKPPFSMKGEDLRHPDGRWYSLEEAIAWSEARQALIAQAEAASPRQARRILAHGTALVTVGQLFEEWFRQPRMNGIVEVEGKKERKPLAVSTVIDYRQTSTVIERFDKGLIWNSPAAAITGRMLGNDEHGVFHQIEVKHGLSTARKVRATLSAMYGWAGRKGRVAHNPVVASTRLPVPSPRIRYGTIAEMKHLVLAAATLGRPEVGLSFLLGLWTGQRQNDRLALADGQMSDDGILFRQLKKNGQPLLIPPAPELAAAIAAAKHRRRDWKVNYHELVLDERTRRPFAASWYKHTVARIRAFAVSGKGRHELTGEPVTIEPMPSLADFHDQDLRDTAVTWLALAGCTIPQIGSITGHSMATIETILKHYLGMHPELARSAITRMVAWYDEKGEAK
jgi:hypothetical protein